MPSCSNYLLMSYNQQQHLTLRKFTMIIERYHPNDILSDPFKILSDPDKMIFYLIFYLLLKGTFVVDIGDYLIGKRARGLK